VAGKKWDTKAWRDKATCVFVTPYGEPCGLRAHVYCAGCGKPYCYNHVEPCPQCRRPACKKCLKSNASSCSQSCDKKREREREILEANGTWLEHLVAEMKRCDEGLDDIVAQSIKNLNVYAEEKPDLQFLVWTDTRVYFPCEDEGHYSVVSVLIDNYLLPVR
jgi:hypothetical protein